MMRLRQTIRAFLAAFLVLLGALQAAAYAQGCVMEHCGADAASATQVHLDDHHDMSAAQADLEQIGLQEDGISSGAGCSPFLCLVLFAPEEPAVAYVMPSKTANTITAASVAVIEQPDRPERPPNL